MNRVLNDWEYSSLKQELRRNLASLQESVRNMDSLKRDVDSQIRDIKYNASAVDRAWEDKLKDEVRKAGAKTGGYSSYSSYSSYDSKIRDLHRIIERCLDKVSSAVSTLASVGSRIESVHRDVSRKVDVLADAYESAVRQLAETSRELKSASQKSDNLSREKSAAERLARDNERRLRSEVEEARRKAVAAGAAAAVAVAAAAAHSDEAENAEDRLAAQRREWERKVSEMRNFYEGEIASLKEMISKEENTRQPDEGSPDTPDQVGVKEELESMRVEGISGEDDLTGACERGEAPQLTLAQMSLLASDYAVLWNEILDDDIIELREVEEISSWCVRHGMHMPEGRGLQELAQEIFHRGEVDPMDAQCLYDRSFMLLKALGAKLDEPSVDGGSGLISWKGKTQLAKAIARRNGNEGAFGGILQLFARKRPCSKGSKWRKPFEDVGISFDEQDYVIDWSVARNPI